MPITFTGRNVKADNDEYPSLVDIAVGLSRQPRFGGQTRQWWSVLDHTLFGDELVKGESDTPESRLAWLLHDAHEAVTGDVPTPFKSQSLSTLQDQLDSRIYAAYFRTGYGGYLSRWHYHIKLIDKRAMRAEAIVVGPSTADRHLSAFGITTETADQVGKDVQELRRVIHRLGLGAPPEPATHRPEDHPLVKTYLSRVMELL